MKEGNASDLYSSIWDENCLTMTVGRGSQVSDRILKEPSKDILEGGIKRGSQATVVKGEQK